MNGTIATLCDHTSIRKFTTEPITAEQEGYILESARRGATAGNMMLYSIIKIRDRETLEKLAKSCDNQPFIREADMALLFVVDCYKWHKYFEKRGVYEAYPMYGTPQISDFVLGMQDAMIAAQNAVIAAESMGIGTCYIGDIMEQKEFHKELFHLPEYTMPATLVVFGNFDYKPSVRPRFLEKHTVFSEVYPEITPEFIEEMYSPKEQNDTNFAIKFYERKMAAPFFKEMIRSIHSYIREWLPKENSQEESSQEEV